MNTSKQVGIHFDSAKITETLVTIGFLDFVDNGIFEVDFYQVPVGKSRMTFRREECWGGEIASLSFRLTRYPSWIDVDDSSTLAIPAEAAWGLVLEAASHLGCSISKRAGKTTITLDNATLAELSTKKSGKKQGVK